MIDGGLIQTLVVGHLWQSVAVAAVLAVALILGRRMRGSTRYNLSVVALVASIALPLAAFIPGESLARAVLDKLEAPPTIAEKQVTPKVEPSLIEQAAAENGVPMWQVQFASNLINAATENGTVPASETALGKVAVENGAPAWAINLAGGALLDAAEPTPAPQPKPLFTLPEIKLPDLNLPDLTLPLLMVWLAGALMLLVRTSRDLIAVERLVATAQPANLPDKLKARMEGVRVAVSPNAPGPMAAGLFRPCIILPENIALTSPGMAALLEHERAHIERCDMAIALAQRVLLALLWWSPALYWISRRIDEEREVACDDAAVDRTGNAKALARSLTIEAENQLWARAPRLAVGAIGPRSQVGRRIKRLIDVAKGAPYAKYSGRIAFAGLALAVAVAAMATPRFNANAQQPGALPPVDDTLEGAPTQSASPQDRVSGPDARDWADLSDLQDLHDHEDLAPLGDDFARLMEDLGRELELSLSGLSPELEVELQGLGAEVAALGVEISSVVSQEVLRELPQIMDEVRRDLEAAGIDIDDHEQWREHSEEVREALEAAREELREALGPEMREEIRAAIEEARAEVSEHRDEIRIALQESQAGMEIARQAMAQARQEIAAARARGDFKDYEKFENRNWNFDFDFDKETIEKLRESGMKMKDAAEKARLDRVKLDGGPGASRLMQAVMAGDDDAVRAEIKAGADPNAAAPGGNSPLMHAVMSGNDEIANLLIDAGADVNKTAPGRGGPLVHATMAGNDEIVRMLLKAGADANEGAPGGRSPLLWAVQAGNDDIVRLLLNAGADPNAKAPGAGTVLIHAVQAGREDIVRLLVGKGADVNAASRSGSPLSVAEMSGNKALADYLRSKGAISKPKSPN